MGEPHGLGGGEQEEHGGYGPDNGDYMFGLLESSWNCLRTLLFQCFMLAHHSFKNACSNEWQKVSFAGF